MGTSRLGWWVPDCPTPEKQCRTVFLWPEWHCLAIPAKQKAHDAQARSSFFPFSIFTASQFANLPKYLAEDDGNSKCKDCLEVPTSQLRSFNHYGGHLGFFSLEMQGCPNAAPNSHGAPHCIFTFMATQPSRIQPLWTK